MDPDSFNCIRYLDMHPEVGYNPEFDSFDCIRYLDIHPEVG